VTTRGPVAAGTFYPRDPAELSATVDALLDELDPDHELRGIVVPHAGYAFSGSVAATAFRRLSTPRRVVLLGPSHFLPLTGCAVTSAEAWATPLGTVPVDEALRSAALAAGARVDDEPHAGEHALEVELPFLQRVCGPDLSVLPVAVGRTEPAAVARLLEALDAFLVVSTDLSHYLPAGEACERDRRTAAAVLVTDTGRIGDIDACGAHALRGAVEHARRAGLRLELLDLRTSADTAGDPGRVVGYGAFAIRSSAPSG
jgi:MEMO1 family protein